MKNVNWGRFVLGALIAAVICFVSDGFLHQKLVDTQWRELMEPLGIAMGEHKHGGMLWFAVFEAGRGFYSTSLWASVAAYQLVFSIIAAIIGAAPYKEEGSAHA